MFVSKNIVHKIFILTIFSKLKINQVEFVFRVGQHKGIEIEIQWKQISVNLFFDFLW